VADGKATYKVALDQTLEQLAKALARRERLQLTQAKWDSHIDDLQDAAEALGRLCGIDPTKQHPELFPEDAEPEVGFTDAVREVFRNADERFLYQPISVREKLKEMGFPIAKYKNPLASIHTILKRLVEHGEIIRVDFEGSSRYGKIPSEKVEK
jgi:hypothetical protein